MQLGNYASYKKVTGKNLNCGISSMMLLLEGV